MNRESSARFALVAGETSGDNLGAKLIDALRARAPNAVFEGVTGPRMRAAGCVSWEAAESLAVMGLVEVIPHLPRLFKIRSTLTRRLIENPPDAFIGVDFKEFNLSLAARLKAKGLTTVQYVSPQVWAWRQGRVRSIGKAVDLVLCLLPFEKKFYDEHAVHAEFVGHPLADQIPLVADQPRARAELGLDATGQYVALLPGSRAGEVSRLAPDFASTVVWLKAHAPEIKFVAALANARAREVFTRALEAKGVNEAVALVEGRSQDVLTASDAVLLASGTATLEATLVKRPMVVTYRLDGLTTLLLRRFKLFKAPFFAQPNLLAGRQVVPEFFNEQVRAEVLGPALLEQLQRPDRAELEAEFMEIHRTLRRDASARAADAILALVERRRSGRAA